MTRFKRAVWRGLLHRIGRRGAFLAMLAYLDYVYAYELWFIPGSNGGLMGNPKVWGLAWLASAIFCTFGIFLRKDRVSYTAAATLKAAWVGMYCVLWFDGFPYAWVNAGFWFILMSIVVMVSSWPDPVLTDHVR